MNKQKKNPEKELKRLRREVIREVRAIRKDMDEHVEKIRDLTWKIYHRLDNIDIGVEEK